MIWTTGSRYEVAILHTAASTLQSQQPPGHQHGVPAVVTEAEEEDVVAVSCVTRSTAQCGDGDACQEPEDEDLPGGCGGGRPHHPHPHHLLLCRGSP